MQDKKISPMVVAINDDFVFPEQIKTIVGTLRHPKQWRILELLIANDDKLSYTELKSILVNNGESKGDFNYHLNELEKSGWIDNKSQVDADVDDKYSSYYYITPFGSQILDGIMSSLKSSSYHRESQNDVPFAFSNIVHVEPIALAHLTANNSNVQMILTDDSLQEPVEENNPVFGVYAHRSYVESMRHTLNSDSVSWPKKLRERVV